MAARAELRARGLSRGAGQCPGAEDDPRLARLADADADAGRPERRRQEPSGDDLGPPGERARRRRGFADARRCSARLAEAQALLIEDADRSGADEAALFHLVNLARERGVDALITARAPPDAWGLKTADLLSRLRLAPIVELGAPDLELTQAVLVKLFNDRQLAVDPALIGYVALRIERSLDAARALVAALDREALARGGPVTRAMAARLLRDEDQQAP